MESTEFVAEKTQYLEIVVTNFSTRIVNNISVYYHYELALSTNRLIIFWKENSILNQRKSFLIVYKPTKADNIQTHD